MKGLIAASSADVGSRFSEAVAWNETHPTVVLHASSSEYRFYVCGDIHVENRADAFSFFLGAAQADTKSHFSILLGDLVMGKSAFPLLTDALLRFNSSVTTPDTLFSTVGNHDLNFGQWEEYRKCFGISTYFFEVETPTGRDLFISLDSGSASLGVNQLRWFSQLLTSKRHHYRHTIVFTHMNMFKTGNAHTSSGILPEEEVYALTELCGQYRVGLFLQGHNHIREEHRFKGVNYVVVDALLETASHPSYCVVDCGEQIDWEFVDYP